MDRNKTSLMVDYLHLILKKDCEASCNDSLKAIDCLSHGFIVLDEQNNVIPINSDAYNEIDATIGVSNYKFNQTFHKSFGTIAESDMATLIEEQLIHYFSTYGLEMFGCNANAYIPRETLELPDCFPNKIVIIKAVSKDTLENECTNFFNSITKPAKEIVYVFTNLIDYYIGDVEDLASFELQIVWYEDKGLIPNDPTSILRYIVYTLTNSTLLVNSHREAMILKQHIAACRRGYFTVSRLNKVYEILAEADVIKMSSIFFRYKKLFLALKSIPGCNSIVNKMRRLADAHKARINTYTIQNITKLIKDGENIKTIEKILHTTDIFNLIKVWNVLNNQLDLEGHPQIYNIRNNSTFVKTVNTGTAKPISYKYMTLINFIETEIHNKLDLSGKVFMLPNNITYAAPVSSKQMIGAIPWGSFLHIEDTPAITMGIAWDNIKGQRVDLDLHMHSKTETFGWNGEYRNGKEIIFTGDMTDAANGAAEAFYFARPENELYNLDISKYSGPESVPFKFCITAEKPDEKLTHRNYTFDASTLMFSPINLMIDSETQNLGFLKDDKFVFYGGSVSNGIGGGSDYYESYLDGIEWKSSRMLMLEDILDLCGATYFYENSKEQLEWDAVCEYEPYASLLPEHLTRDTLVNLIAGKI